MDDYCEVCGAEWDDCTCDETEWDIEFEYDPDAEDEDDS